MRIEDRSRIKNNSATSKGGAVRSGSSLSFKLPSMDNDKTINAPAAASALSGVDALLTLQEVDEREAKRKRAVKRGSELLDKLEYLKLGLLDGEVSTQTLSDLTQLVRESRNSLDDPKLEEILSHIELRAEVEMAKLSKFG